jgi:hypothetical protein
MATGEITLVLPYAFQRLIDLLAEPKHARAIYIYFGCL